MCILFSNFGTLQEKVKRFCQWIIVCAGDEPADYWLSDLCGQLSAVVASKPAERLTSQIGEFAVCTVEK